MSIARHARLLEATKPVPFVETRARPLNEVLHTILAKPTPDWTEWDRAYVERIEREAE